MAFMIKADNPLAPAAVSVLIVNRTLFMSSFSNCRFGRLSSPKGFGASDGCSASSFCTTDEQVFDPLTDADGLLNARKAAPTLPALTSFLARSNSDAGAPVLGRDKGKSVLTSGKASILCKTSLLRPFVI